MIVKFAGDDNLVIDGTLIAEGTADNLITFTSNQTFKSAGNWGEIQFRDTSVDKDCLLEYAVIEYGETGVNYNKAASTIQHCTIQQHSNYGIYANNANNANNGNNGNNGNNSPIIQNNTISNNSYGIYTQNCNSLVIQDPRKGLCPYSLP